MIFIDTTFFVGAIDEDDNRHSESAQLIYKIIKEGKINAATTDYVINESVSILNNRRKVTFTKIRNIVIDILNSQKIEVMFIDETLLREALEIYEQYKGDLSLTDSTSVLIMKKYHINEIYSHDSDFDRVDGIKRKVS